MGFIVIGVILLIAGLVISRLNDKIHVFGKPVTGLGGALILVGIIMASIVQIEAGNVGIRVLFGNVQPTVLQSGLHIINPFMEIVF